MTTMARYGLGVFDRQLGTHFRRGPLACTVEKWCFAVILILCNTSKMVLGQVSRTLVRKFSTSAVARSQHWQQYGIPGSNLPFSIKNRYKLTLMFAAFFSSGFTAPFLVVVHQLLKK